jgi:hypothetical protein
VEQVYHQRVHTETDMPPLARFLAAGPPVPTPAALLTEAFRWGEWRNADAAVMPMSGRDVLGGWVNGSARSA